MSEVQRFWSHEASNIRCVREADFDRVTAERDAALGREAELKLELGTMSEIFDMQEDKIDALQQRLTAADERADSFDRLYTSSLDERDQLQQRADVLERDKVRIDWLAEQPVDTLYLDDGRIIDIAGRVDLRDAIDAAMAALKPAEVGGDAMTEADCQLKDDMDRYDDEKEQP